MEGEGRFEYEIVDAFEMSEPARFRARSTSTSFVKKEDARGVKEPDEVDFDSLAFDIIVDTEGTRVEINSNLYRSDVPDRRTMELLLNRSKNPLNLPPLHIYLTPFPAPVRYKALSIFPIL